MTHHTTNYSTLKLKTSNNRTINIHNLNNSDVTTTKTNKSIIQLKKKFKKSANEKHIVLKNFNFHHAAWKKIDVSKKNRTSEMLIKIAKTHEMKQLLASKTIIYSNKDNNNTIDFIFVISLLIENRINCRTKSNQHFFDHYSIEITFNLKTIKQFATKKNNSKKRTRRCWKSTWCENWIKCFRIDCRMKKILIHTSLIL